MRLKEKIIYQIFPRSFMDANNDGNGDLKGIIEKLDYIKDLGVDVIWLCPIYETEFKDAGYDVLDYFSIWKVFGTLEDFKKLVKEAKKRNLEIMLDIVLNHTSNKHQWFLKALEDKNSEERNYYIWTDKPTKAESIFGGSAWEYVPHLKKYYFHLFAKEQVDINWANPKAREAMARIIDFWYELGVKYFRLDAIQHVAKDFNIDGTLNHSFAKKMVEYLQDFLRLAFADKSDAYFIGEASGIDAAKILKYANGKEKIATSFYNFSWWWIGWGKKTGRNGYDSLWNPKDFANEGQLKIQNNDKITSESITNFLTNHDTSRAISRWGDENFFWKESAKSLALMQFAMKGLQVIYFGEEIGMLNPGFSSRKEFRDVDAFNSYEIFVDKEKKYTEDEMTKYHSINGRDNSRFPMQWNNESNFGFNKGAQTWIKLGKNIPDCSVAQQEKDSHSILNFYKKLIKLRYKYKNIWIDGKNKMKLLDNDLIQVTKNYKDKKLVFIINVTKHEKYLKSFKYDEILLSSYSDNKKFNSIFRPYESIVFSINNKKEGNVNE